MIHDDDGHWYPETGLDPAPKTNQDIILQRQWAKRRALELLAGTEAGKRIIRLRKPKGKKLP